MAYKLNEKIRDLRPYDPITGNYQIRLDANESFVTVSNDLLDKITDEIKNISYNRYPDPMASELCKSFAEYYNVKHELVTAGNGSDELISVIFNAFLMKGDKILTLSPDFSMYSFYSSIVEAECIQMKKEQDLTIDIDKLIACANSEDVKLIIFSNPCNPTSLGLKKGCVRKLIKSVNALVVLDEAYMDFWNESLLDEVETYDNLIILRTCSKALGMAGIRLGFAVANLKITNALKAVKSPYNVNLLTQKIGSIVLNEHQLNKYSINKIISSRDKLYSSMLDIEQSNKGKLHVYPTVTNFIFLNIPFCFAEKIYNYLLKCGIAVRLMGNYLRITAGTGEENEEFLKYFKKSLENIEV
jgi:histidinol-phosphate aminotransferase